MLFLFLINYSFAQTMISSITELNSLLTQDNVNAVMIPGTYTIGPDDFTSGLLPNATLFEFSGSNSIYDFTGVTFAFDTNIFRSYGNVSVTEIRVAGQKNVIKNLTMEDIGTVVPRRTALGIQLDGLDNRVEGVHMTVRGSFPYGYGDIFGKGSGYVIKHYKHSAILVRGERNHLKNCTIIHRAYGHGIFCQGSIDALIEGCTLEGETSTSDAVLAETSGPAFEKGFMTVWGYKLTPGWTFSLHEDGIRAYNNGAHHITGVSTNTKNMRVIDCTVKNLRSGVTIGFCDGEKYVENCTAIGTESGFWVGSNGEIVNSRGDAIYGPLYATDYQNDKNSKINLTIIDNDNDVYGSHPSIFIGGSGHNVTLKSTETNTKDNYKILIAGIRLGMRFVEGRDAKYYDQSASNITLNNESGYPVVLEGRSTSSSIQSCGVVTGNGTNNTVSLLDNCEILSVEDSFIKKELSIYPNPANNQFFIDNNRGNSFVLYNSLGLVVLRNSIISNHQSVNLRGIIKGVYFMKIINAGTVRSQKLIVN